MSSVNKAILYIPAGKALIDVYDRL